MAQDKPARRPRAETPKGFRDYFGAEVTERKQMLDKVAAVYHLYGFDPLETSAVETVEALGIPVCLQVRFPGLPMVHSMAARFPKVRIIIDHLMKPELDDGVPYAKAAPVFELAKYPNVFLKLTSDTVRASKQGKASPQSFFTQLLEAFGVARIAWGSNFPASSGTLKEILDESRQALSFLPSSDQAQIFCHTARMLYPALAD
jgi:predicted TIM-barrel fold metal-dependent hydrolase